MESLCKGCTKASWSGTHRDPYCRALLKAKLQPVWLCAYRDPINFTLETQVGGEHYKNFKIQPSEFIHKNNLGFLQGCIIKRICRYNKPTGGGLKDLEKIKHEVDLLIEFEYNKQ